MGARAIVGAAVVVLVRDLERALRFYVDSLGFHLRSRHAGPSVGFAEVEAPGVKILLQESDGPTGPEPHPGGASRVSLVLESDGLEASMAALEGRGVEFATEIEEDAEYRTVVFTDPDGALLRLRERRG
ncbi:MAG TPA: VOC family protein [Anaeromyxobacteraceae bacterium]|nr:VOC family protein [Anaeromyxobacteraceae bacterium]